MGAIDVAEKMLPMGAIDVAEKMLPSFTFTIWPKDGAGSRPAEVAEEDIACDADGSRAELDGVEEEGSGTM